MGIPTPSPPPSHLQSPTPHCCAPLRKMGAPQGARGAELDVPRASCCAGAWGQGLGKLVCPPQRLLCQCLTSWSDTPSLVPQPKGGLRFALLSPPEAGTAGEVHCNRPPEGLQSRTGWGLWWRGCQHLWPLRLHRGPPSAKHFPLSRSKNTKLGTPGTPHPGSPAPFPPPPQGGHLGRGARKEC